MGALVLGVYWRGLFGGFFFDDGPSILQVAGVRMETLNLESLRAALTSGGAGPSGRPVAQLSFALNFLFSGYSAFAFKATNLIIHFVGGLTVFGLSFRLLNGSEPRVKPIYILFVSAALAALWLLHPIQLLPVLHAVQRMTSLSAVFLLAALLLHIRGRDKKGPVGAALIVLSWGVLWPLSIFSKETGALFPLFALAWELTLHRHSVGSLDRFARVLSGMVVLLLPLGIVYLVSPWSQWLWSGYQIRPFSVIERLLTEPRILWFYLGQMVLPRLNELGLYHDDIAISTSLVKPWTTLTAIIGLVGLVWFAWRSRDRAPLISFGITWFFVSHLLESTLLPLELAHEHRNYVALFGILLVGAWAFIGALQTKGALKTTGISVFVAILSYSVLVTGLRADQFGDSARRTQIEAQHHRTSARAQHEAGQYLTGLVEAANANELIYSLASAHFQRACELDPNSKMCLLGLIHLSCQAGVPVQTSLIVELGRRLKGTPFAPGDRNVLHSIKELSVSGNLCLVRSDVDGLFSSALANLGVSPGVQAMLHSWHADYLWLYAKDIHAATEALAKSLKLNPSDLSNRFKWAQLILISGDRERAHRLLLELRNQDLSGEEKKILDELLATFTIAGR